MSHVRSGMVRPSWLREAASECGTEWWAWSWPSRQATVRQDRSLALLVDGAAVVLRSGEVRSEEAGRVKARPSRQDESRPGPVGMVSFVEAVKEWYDLCALVRRGLAV